MPQRFRWHDFRRPGWYLFTFEAAAPDRPFFARMDEKTIRYSLLGVMVMTQWRRLCEELEGALVTKTFQLLPDRLRVVVEVRSQLSQPVGIHLGRFKSLATGWARRMLGYHADKPLWAKTYEWRVLFDQKDVDEAVVSTLDYSLEGLPDGKTFRRMIVGLGGVDHPRLPSAWPGHKPGGETGPLVWKSLGKIGLLDEVGEAICLSPGQEGALRRQVTGLGEEEVPVIPAIYPVEREAVLERLAAGSRAVVIKTTPLTWYSCAPRPEWRACLDGRLLALSPFAPGSRGQALEPEMVGNLVACAQAIARVPRADPS